MRKSYPSDTSREAFEQIRPVLGHVRKRTTGKGYDAGKKVSGIKRHIAVDTQGFHM